MSSPAASTASMLTTSDPGGSKNTTPLLSSRDTDHNPTNQPTGSSTVSKVWRLVVGEPQAGELQRTLDLFAGMDHEDKTDFVVSSDPPARRLVS